MSIASEKIKAASERFLLVRINPARYILPVFNSPLYEITLSVTLNKIERNGVELTKVTSTPGSNDEWYQDESTGLVQVKLAGAPNDTTNVLIAYYYLFYTGTIFRAISEDPEDTMTTIRDWQPLISNYPTIIQSFDNILQGVFSLSDTTIKLINPNGELQNYLGDNDTFYNKEVEIWLCINTVDNIEKIFFGTIKSIAFTQNTVNLRCTDSFNHLKATASMGDTNDEIYYSKSGFPDINPREIDKPCPYVIGRYSYWSSLYYGDTPATGIKAFHFDEGHKAACISTSRPLTLGNNRNWGACRQKDVAQTQTFSGIQGALDVAGGYTFLFLNPFTNIQIGDTIKYTTSGTDYYAHILYLGTFFHASFTFNAIVATGAGTLFTTSTLTPLKSFAIRIKNDVTGTSTAPYYGRDYIIDESAITSGGNIFMGINFLNNFESNFSLATLDPDQDHVFFRTSNDSPQTHGVFLKDVLDIVGTPTDAASFTAADSDLPVNVAFSIPNFDEQDYKTYLKYCQDVLGSTLGYLKINSSFEIEYNLISAPTSTEIRNSALTLQGGTQASVDYQDIITQIIAYNPHNSSDWITSFTPSPSETRDDPKARWLQGFVNVDRFRHCLETITARIDSHIGIKSKRTATYTFETATQDIDSSLGDDLQLENKIVLGTSKIQDVKIITIQKSPGKVTIEASDLKGA